MGLSHEPMREKRLMALCGSAGRLRPAAPSLVDSLRYFLTPALWKQAKQARGPRRRPRWAVQPLGKAGSAPAVWLTALVHLRLGVPWAWRWGKGTAAEREHLRRLLPTLPADALLVADAGYVGYDLLRTLLERKVCFLIRMSCQATF